MLETVCFIFRTLFKKNGNADSTPTVNIFVATTQKQEACLCQDVSFAKEVCFQLLDI